MNKPSKAIRGGLILPTEAEEKAINQGIASDPDTMEITAAMAGKLQLVRGPGRPAVARPKVPTTLRIDDDVLSIIKHSGKGWQTRINDVLRDAVRRGKFKDATAD